MRRNFPGKILLQIIFVWVGVAVVNGQTSYCQYNGYNIAPLQNSSSDYILNIGLYIYYVNVCGPVLAKQCLPSQAVVCQTWNGGKATLSLYNSGTPGPLARGTGNGEGFTVQFNGGDGGRTMEIDFVCAAGSGVGSPQLTGENPKNHYVFTWGTQYVCSSSGSGGLSGGSIFLILLLCLAVVYIVVGVLFNKFKKQATGIELIPNVEFWTSIPGLVRDGFMLIINKIRGRGGYSQV